MYLNTQSHLAPTPPSSSQAIPILRPSETLREAELKLQILAGEIFLAFCKDFVADTPLEQRKAMLLSLSDIPLKVQLLFNKLHGYVKMMYESMVQTSGDFPFPGGDLYMIPKKSKETLIKVFTDFTAQYPDYLKQYNSVLILSPKYQSYLDMGDIKEFAELYKKDNNKTAFRAVALQKIANLKSKAYQQENGSLPSINQTEVHWVRNDIFDMFCCCEDYEVRKKSLIELNDLLAADTLTSTNLGDIEKLHQNMESYIKGNAENIQGELSDILGETYAQIVHLILLYSPSKNSKHSIILSPETINRTKQQLDALNISADEDAQFWKRYARDCLNLLITPQTDQDKWLNVTSAVIGSAVETAATIYFNPSSLVTVLEQSYSRIRDAVVNNISTAPYWLPPVVMVNRYCQRMMNDIAPFKQIVPTLGKFKHIEDVRYGIIITLERIALKTPMVPVQIEVLKLLLQYVNIQDETVSCRLLQAFARVLQFRQNVELSNTVYLLLTLIDETKSFYGSAVDKLKALLSEFRAAHPTIDKRTHLPFLLEPIKYFLKLKGILDDFGGLHTNINLKGNHADLLKIIDRIIKISGVDVYGFTLYHKNVLNKSRNGFGDQEQ